MEFPHALKQHRPRDDLPVVPYQEFKNLEFARLKLDPNSVAFDGPLQQVDFEVGNFHKSLVWRRVAGAASTR